MRTVSLTFRKAANAENTEEVIIALLTITHPSIADDPLYVSSDPTTRLSDTPLTYGTISRGNNYIFAPLQLALPDDIDERAPTARLLVENVSQDIIAAARQFTTPPTCKIELVMSSTLDVVEVEYPEFDVKNIQYDANQITLELSIDSLTDEPMPAGSFNPSGFGGLF